MMTVGIVVIVIDQPPLGRYCCILLAYISLNNIDDITHAHYAL